MRAVTIVEFADGEIKIAVNKPHDDPLTPDEVGIALMQYGIAKLMENVPKGAVHDFADIPLSEETNSEGEEMPTKRCAWNGYHGAPDSQCTNRAMPGHDLCEFHSQGVIALEKAYSEGKDSAYHYWGVRSPAGNDYPRSLKSAIAHCIKYPDWKIIGRSYEGPWKVVSER